ncbi:MAG: hypothetical protein U5K74_03075 [Gemmatimonadaceae bacterium]|nr:hypothetical protein [Gemmatimonadaceae bacterium]
MTRLRHLLLAVAATCVAAPLLPGQGQSKPSTSDPRYSLRGGWNDAQEAISNLTLLAHRNRPDGFFNPADAGDFAFVNSDLAFDGQFAFIGGYHGFQIWDVSTPGNPTLRLAFPCPGGQGDLSVYRTLLFMSVEENKGRLDCGGQGVSAEVSPERFRGSGSSTSVTSITRDRWGRCRPVAGRTRIRWFPIRRTPGTCTCTCRARGPCAVAMNWPAARTVIRAVTRPPPGSAST